MTLAEVALLAGAGLLAGGLNAIAGGGSFLTFPSLVFAGVPPIEANATSTIALWPATLASAGAYRRELAAERSLAVWLLGSSILGGGVGALLLVYTPPELFVRLVPFLLLAATLLFTFGPRLRLAGSHGSPRGARPWVAAALQLPIAVYGGYFGGGIGMMMLALFALLGMANIHHMNALKTVLSAAINGVAVALFIAAGKVEWTPGCIVLASAIGGGWAGASLARRLDPRSVRRLVVILGWAMTLYFFVWG